MKKLTATTRRVALTVDVEQDAPPYFSTWQGVEEGMPLLLSILAAHDVRATFFVTGEAASRFPGLIARVSQVHEIGCHGFDHTRFDRMMVSEQRMQIQEATTIIEKVTGCKPAGFRAPNFRYSPDTARIVYEAGYLYDASSARYHRGQHNLNRYAPQIANTFPSSLLRLPALLSRPVLDASVRLLPLVVLDFHPWELVRISGIRLDMCIATGAIAVRRLNAALGHLRSAGVDFITMRTAAALHVPATPATRS